MTGYLNDIRGRHVVATKSLGDQERPQRMMTKAPSGGHRHVAFA